MYPAIGHIYQLPVTVPPVMFLKKYRRLAATLAFSLEVYISFYKKQHVPCKQFPLTYVIYTAVFNLYFLYSSL